MKKNLFFLFLCPILLFAEIFESSKLEDLFQYVDEDTLVAFDIDNTLMDAAQQLGSSQCGYYFCDKFIELGLPPEVASKLEMQRWMILQPLIKVQAIDPQTAEIIKKLQKKAQVIAVTARQTIEADHTHRQLTSISIQLKNQLSCEEKIEFPFESPAMYHKGILFCSYWNSKGAILTALLNKMSIKPKIILFVDDKLKHVQEVEKAVQKLGIDFIGMRFSGCDQRIAELDPKIIDLQWAVFPLIISDEEAKALLINQNQPLDAGNPQ